MHRRRCHRWRRSSIRRRRCPRQSLRRGHRGAWTDLCAGLRHDGIGRTRLHTPPAPARARRAAATSCAGCNSAGQPMTGCDVRIRATRRHRLRRSASAARSSSAATASCAAIGTTMRPHARRFATVFCTPATSAKRDDAGFVYVVDRLKDMIVSGGENIYSREVENALSSHPAVLEAAVVGGPDERWGEAVVAFVVQAARRDRECRSIARALRQDDRHLQASARRSGSSDALPKLPNGKVEKFKLRELRFGRAKRARSEQASAQQLSRSAHDL